MKLSSQPLSDHEMSESLLFSEMREAFDILSASKYDGIHGVLKIDSPRPNSGPTVGITICTHGNEIAGLAPIVHYLREDRLKKILQVGSVMFVLNNIEAANRFFNAESYLDKERARFVDLNMNRLPKDVLDRRCDVRSEIKRVLELNAIFKMFDAALDIHSVSIPSPTMIVEVKQGLSLLNGAPIDTVLTNIVSVQRGIPVSALYGGDRIIPVLAVEAGHHGQDQAFVDTTKTVQAFLQNLKIVEGLPPVRISNKVVYNVSHSVLFPNTSYGFVKSFDTFAPIKKGDTIANGDGDDILCPKDGHILFAAKGEIDPENDEAAFISDPVMSS